MSIIRRATDEETKEILKHGLQVMKEATLGYVKPRWELVHQLSSQFLSSGGFYLVYVESGILKGWLGLTASYDIYEDEYTGILYEVYVFPAYRNKGIAKKLCFEAIKFLESQGYSSLELNVFAGHPAKEFYSKLGFRDVVSTMKRYNHSNLKSENR